MLYAMSFNHIVLTDALQTLLQAGCQLRQLLDFLSNDISKT
jgi:hypothetical protein